MALKDYMGAITGGAQWAADQLGIGHGKQDKRQVNQARELNKINQENANLEHDLKMKYWKETGIGAQLKAGEEAGVSRAAILGGAGGGLSGGATVSSNPGTASDSASTMQAQTNKAMAAAQLGLIGAQTKNINADTANKEKGTEKTGAEITNINKDTEVKDTTIDSLKAGITSTEAKTALTESQKLAQELANDITNSTKKWSIKKAEYEAEVMYENLENQKRNNKFNQETYDTSVKLINQELTNKIAEEGNLNAQSKKALNEIGIAWAEIRIAKQNANTNEQNMYINDRSVNYQGRDIRLKELTGKFNREMQKWDAIFRANKAQNDRIDSYVDRALGILTGGIIQGNVEQNRKDIDRRRNEDKSHDKETQESTQYFDKNGNRKGSILKRKF